MTMAKNDPTGEVITVAEIHRANLRVNIVGTSPLVPHAMSAKAAGSLLFPAPKKNATERATSMKHEPYEEYRDAAYKFRDEDKTDTRLYMPAGAFHGAMAQAAIDMIGVKKAQIARLTSVPGNKIPVFGVPQIFCSIVRSSDMARTPDIRTLPILPEWAATFTVSYVDSLIKQQSIVNLLGAAGDVVGIGDGRPEKGKLTFGQFRLVNDDDPDFIRICKMQRRAAQDQALKDPQFYDIETQSLLTWFEEEKVRRTAAPPRAVRVASTGKRSGNGGKEKANTPT